MENFNITEAPRATYTANVTTSASKADVNDVLVRINKLSKQANSAETDIAVRMTLKHQITRLSASIPAMQDDNGKSAASAINNADIVLARSFANIQSHMAEAMVANTTAMTNADALAFLL